MENCDCFYFQYYVFIFSAIESSPLTKTIRRIFTDSEYLHQTLLKQARICTELDIYSHENFRIRHKTVNKIYIHC